MLSWTLPLALLYIYACLQVGASSKEVTPPDTMIYSYPTADVPVGQQILLGMDGGVLDVSSDYHGLGWNMSSSIIFPIGTTSVLVIAGNMFEGGGSSHCLGSGGVRQPTNSLAAGAFFIPDVVGTHTAGWDVIYGTSDDTTIANETSCDVSHLSLETFHFNASFNVVEARNSAFQPEYTTITSDFPSEPTGKFFENSGSQGIGMGVGGLIGVVALMIRQLV